MVKLIACTIPILIFIFGDPVLGVISLVIPFFVFFVSWIIKSNKQQPGESDEDYAKRMERLKEKMKETNNNLPIYESPDLVKDFKYSYLPCNIFYHKK